MTNLFKTFDVNIDSVQLDDQLIKRPDYVSIMQWTEFWGEGFEPQETSYYVEQLESEIADLEKQNQAFSDEIDALEDEISGLEAEVKSLSELVTDLDKKLHELTGE